MNKIRNFEIQFPGSRGLFKAGETMNGRITYTLSERMSIREISIVVHGRAEVSFQAGKYTYSKKEKYIKETITLLTPEEGVTHVEPGDYSHDFRYCLKTDIPSSFEGKYGHVRYSLEGRIDRGIWKPTITKMKKFLVKNDHDLNILPNIEEPTTHTTSTTDGCCWWKQGDLEVTVRLPRRGYTPGESVLLDIDVNNNTTARGYISVEFAQFTSFFTRSGSKRWKQVIHTRPRVTVNPGDTAEIQQEPVHIPHLPPSGLPWCKLVDIDYNIRVKVKVGRLECKIPLSIVIGTIPLRSVFDGPTLSPPPYSQNPEPFTALWQHPLASPAILPSPWQPVDLPQELPPSPPGYTAISSQTPSNIDPPSYVESQQQQQQQRPSVAPDIDL